METHGSISTAEASAALAQVRGSRARVAWSGYPAWYWLASAAGLAALPFTLLFALFAGTGLTLGARAGRR
jgi:hypothetical protein